MASINRPKQKKWEPTSEDLAVIKAYSAIRLPVDQIACLLKIDKRTLEREANKNSALRSAIDTGRASASATVRRTLFDMATKDREFPALKFWCQTQEGFKISQNIEHSGPDGAPIETVQMTPTQRNAEIERLLAVRAAGMSEDEEDDESE